MKRTALFLCGIVFMFCFLVCGCSKKEDRIVLKFSSWGSQSEVEILRPLLDEFESENPDIRVQFMHIPQNYFQKLHLLFASNLAPDVVFVNNFYAPKYIKAGLFADLTPYFSQEKGLYFQSAIDSSTYDEKLYVLPRDVSVMVVYYNKELFSRFGIPVPQKDWSLEEFAATAMFFSKRQTPERLKIYGTGYESDSLYWLPFLFSQGGGIIENGELIIDSPQSIKALQYYGDLCNKLHAAPSKSESASLTMGQMFLQGRLAMHISGRWLVPKYRKDADFDWDIINLPKGAYGSVSALDSSGYAVAESSKHKEEAVRLIRFLSTKESCEELAKSGLIVPARKDAAYSEAFLAPDKKPGHSKVFLETVLNGKPTPVTVEYQRINDILKVSLEPLFTGEKSAKDVITPALVKKLQECL